MDTITDEFDTSLPIGKISAGVMGKHAAYAGKGRNAGAWTDERVDLVKALWKEGLSASDIAAELDCGFTRNAVIGKVHRLGLDGRKKQGFADLNAEKRLRAKANPKVRAHRMRVPREHLGSEPLALQQPDPEFINNVIPIHQRIASVLDLKESTCHWPVGDPGTPGFFFCGGTVTKQSYCSHHARVAFNGIPVRKRVIVSPPRKF